MASEYRESTLCDMTEVSAAKKPSTFATIVKLVVSAAAIVVGLFLVFGATTPAVADAVFVGSIALVLAVYLWAGVTKNQARIVSLVLLFVAAYAFLRGFDVLQLAFLRQLGGIAAIVSGVILLIPFIRQLVSKP